MNSQTLYISAISIPNHLEIKETDQGFWLAGPLGSTSLNFQKVDPKGLSGVSFNPTARILKISTPNKALNGAFKKFVANKIHGVLRGFLVCLKITGIGYRASLENQSLIFKLGYSHDIVYNIPNCVKIFLGDATTVYIFGIEKNQVTQLASKIRNLRKPSVYKGKGIQYSHETVSTKTGKRK